MNKGSTGYPPEFRQQIVDLVIAGRRPIELAREFGCHISSIKSWVHTHKLSSGVASSPSTSKPLGEAERHELVQLRREVRQLRTERDILSKATAWFANHGTTSGPSTR